MDNKKFCFISCVNNKQYYNECLYYISKLNIPEGYTVEMLSIEDATSMTSGYNKAMKMTDAKYKIYLHQDTFILDENFLYVILGIFKDSSVGMIGAVGSKTISTEGYWWNTGNIYGNYYDNVQLEMKKTKSLEEKEQEYIELKAIDGFIMITQYDIPWREDIFDNWHYYDYSQSIEFLKSGYKVVTPNIDKTWVMHDCGLVNLDLMDDYYKYNKIYVKEYKDWLCKYNHILKGEGTMEKYTNKEVEALKELKEYNKELVNAIKNIIPELRREKKADIEDYFKDIINGINLEINILNTTINYLNYEHEVISKDDINNGVKKINEAIQEKYNDLEFSYIFEKDLLPFFEKLQKVLETTNISYINTCNELEVKPKFNLKYYRGDDLYSDGDVEEKIIQIIRDNEPEDYSKAIYENFSWPTYYHLTHLRKNILNWYPFKKDSDILEIGCGLGAITNMLCEKGKSVTAVELSKRRATATLFRCREQENLEIIVGNLNEIHFEKKYDYITLIGVLEYQGEYTISENPYIDFIKKIKELLKPNGKLLIGIENKYGLKYWCGAREDHTGIPFDGINGYKMGNNCAQTFSKQELDEMIKSSGFKNTFFYYPMPDYKLPTVIYSENKLPENENMQNLIPYYTDNSTLIADEMEIYKDLIKNNVYQFFANSFLVECSDSAVGEVSFVTTSCERMLQYQVLTRFREEKIVEKCTLDSKNGEKHLIQTWNNQEKMKQAGLKVWSSTIEDGVLKSELSQDTLLETFLVEKYNDKDIDGIYEIFDKVYEEILRSSKHVDNDENILYKLKIAEREDEKDYGVILEDGFLDMILRNAFYKDKEIYWFDQEWVLENVPAKYILFTAITELYYSYPQNESVITFQKLAERYEFINMIDEFKKMRNKFFELVVDPYHAIVSKVFRGSDREKKVDNIKKILNI